MENIITSYELIDDAINNVNKCKGKVINGTYKIGDEFWYIFNRIESEEFYLRGGMFYNIFFYIKFILDLHELSNKFSYLNLVQIIYKIVCH